MALRVFFSDSDSFLGGKLSNAILTKLKTDDCTVICTGSCRSKSAGPAVGSAEALYDALVCDVVVLNLLTALGEANTILEALKTMGTARKRVILTLSSTSTWEGCAVATGMAPLLEYDWAQRKPSATAAPAKSTEDAALRLVSARTSVHVVAAGLIYGDGEAGLRAVCTEAWACNAATKVPAGHSGSHAVPSIHIRDLCAIATAVISHACTALGLRMGSQGQGKAQQGGKTGTYSNMLSPYIIAVDRGVDTPAAILRAISREFGTGQIETHAPTSLLAGQGIEPGLASQWSAAMEAPALAFATTSCTAHSGLLSSWHSAHGPVAFMHSAATEFRIAHALAAPRVVVAGPPASGRTTAGEALGQRLGVPVVSAVTALALIRSGNLSALEDSSPGRTKALQALREGVLSVEVAAAAAAANTVAAAAADMSAKAAAEAAEKEKAAAAKAKAPAKGSKAAPEEQTEVAPPPAVSAPTPEPEYARPCRLPASLVARCIRAVLTSPRCNRQGWVLEGWPRTWQEGHALFGLQEGDDGIRPLPAELAPGAGNEEESSIDANLTALRGEKQRPHVPLINVGEPLSWNAALLPTLLVAIQADDALLERLYDAGNAASPAATGTKRSSVVFTRRLARHRLHEDSILSMSLMHLLHGKAGVRVVSLNLETLLAQPCAYSPDTAAALASCTAAIASRGEPTLPSLPTPLGMTLGLDRDWACVALGITQAVLAALREYGQGQVFAADFLRTKSSALQLLTVASADSAANETAASIRVHGSKESRDQDTTVTMADMSRPVVAPSSSSTGSGLSWGPIDPLRIKESAVLEVRTGKLRTLLAATLLPSLSAGLVEAAHLHSQGAFIPRNRVENGGPKGPIHVVAAHVLHAAAASMASGRDIRAASAGPVLAVGAMPGVAMSLPIKRAEVRILSGSQSR